MKKSVPQERQAPAKKKEKTSKSAKSDWHFDHVVQNASAEQMDRTWDAFIEVVEKEGLYCGGGLHPLGGCKACEDEG